MRGLLIVVLILSAATSATASARTEPSRAEVALGTVCLVYLYDRGTNRVYQEIFSRINEIEKLMSVNIYGTDVARVNAAAGTKPVQVHEDTFTVIERAVYFAGLSGGAFDPTVGPLVSLWDIAGENPRVPPQAEIDDVLPLINWRNIELDREQCSVFLKHSGMALDLGAIAKGYAAGEAAAVVEKSGIKQAIINLGGDIVVCGEKRDKSPWRVGVQNPHKERGSFLGILQVSAAAAAAGSAAGGGQQAVVTSGVYERFFEKDGTRYHHIFSPFSGYPANNGLLSVTVIADNAADADALSTAVFVLGYEKGKELIESLPGAEAVFVFEDMSVRKTSGANFKLTDNAFHLKNN